MALDEIEVTCLVPIYPRVYSKNRTDLYLAQAALMRTAEIGY